MIITWLSILTILVVVWVIFAMRSIGSIWDTLADDQIRDLQSLRASESDRDPSSGPSVQLSPESGSESLSAPATLCSACRQPRSDEEMATVGIELPLSETALLPIDVRICNECLNLGSPLVEGVA